MSGENKETTIRNFRILPEENEQLRKDAYAHGMNVTDYIKWLVKKEREEKDGTTD